MSDATLLGGRYRLQDPLGRGGMGTVYAAVQEGLGRRVAVKLLDPRLAEDRVQLERFRREAEVVAALGHPNIVQVTDFQYPDNTNPQPFLVMELLHGESLGSCLAREGAMAGNRAAFVAAQVLSALTAAHRAGVVHRDIKPDNIFLLSDAAIPDTVKVLDFGIAKLGGPLSGGGAAAKLTSTGTMLGTPAFMAPEQARGSEDLDARADIYAVGATMYQALSGKMPYEASSIPALLFAIVEQTPAPLQQLRPDLPPALIAVVERAMAKDRNARYPDAESMREALAPWSGLKSTLHPPAMTQPISVTAPTIASSHPHPVVTPQLMTPAPVTSTPVGVAPAAPTQVAAYAPQAPVSPRDQKRARNRQIIIGLAIAFAGWRIMHTAQDCGAPKFQMSNKDKEEAKAAGLAIASQVVAALSPSASVSAPPPPPPSVSASAVASSSVAVAASAPSPSVRHLYSGERVTGGSRDFGGCKGCDWQGYGDDLRVKSSALDACVAASAHEPPLHESIDYDVAVDETGAYTFTPIEHDVPPRLDACIRGVLASIRLNNHAHAGTFHIGFNAECKKWAPPENHAKWCPD